MRLTPKRCAACSVLVCALQRLTVRLPPFYAIASYDDGNSVEAKRMAVILRILLHDTKKSKGLLAQLGLQDKKFYDSSNYEAFNETPWDVLVYVSLIALVINHRTHLPEFIPILDRSENKTAQWISFALWWTMTVIKDTQGNRFSRKALVLNMADTDGGAHVDPSLTMEYASISRENSLGISGKAMKSNNFAPALHPERAAIRQISHEILKTLKPGYKKSILVRPDIIQYNVLLFGEPLKIDPNKPCPCGSGKVYSDCHGILR